MLLAPSQFSAPALHKRCLISVSDYYNDPEHNNVKSLNQTSVFLINIMKKLRDTFKQVIGTPSSLPILSSSAAKPRLISMSAIMLSASCNDRDKIIKRV